MACKSRNIFLFLLLGIAGLQVAHAQFRLPPFDVELKASQVIIPSNANPNTSAITINNFETTNIYAAAHLQFGQHIGLGWLYSRSFRGLVSYSSNSGLSPAPEKALMLMSGPDLRISTGRGKKSRFFLSLNYVNVELVDDKGGYRQASKLNAVGASIGWMRRLSNTVYLNIIEVGAKGWMGEKSYWLDQDVMLEAKSGVTINFSRRK